MLTDRDGHLHPFAVGTRVVAAHDALQLGKLAHHGGEQVALAQLAPRGASHRAARRPRRRRRCRARRCARILSPSEPSCAWKVTASSAATRAASGCAPVLLPEEGGIREPRPHDALVARAHHCGVAALDVADRDEPRHQPPGAVLDREVALVILERRDQHFARQRQEARLERPGDRHRPFDQRGDFLEQRLLDDRPAVQAQRGEA